VQSSQKWFFYFFGITYEINPRIFDEKRGNAALLIKNSGVYFISKRLEDSTICCLIRQTKERDFFSNSVLNLG